MSEPSEDMRRSKELIRELIETLQTRATESKWPDQKLRDAYKIVVWSEDDFLEQRRRQTIEYPPLKPETAAAYERLFGFGDAGAKYAPKLIARRLERKGDDQQQKFNITPRIMVRIQACAAALQIHSEDQSFEDRTSWNPFLERVLAAVKGETGTPADLGNGASKTDLRANQHVGILSPFDERQADMSLQESDSNLQTLRPTCRFGEESEIEKAPLVRDGRAPSRETAQPSISRVLVRGVRRVSWTIAGAVIGLIIQAAAVAANYWLTGKPLEAVVGLFGAYAVPVVSAIIGAILGGLFSASRSQRSKKSVLLEK